MSSQWMVASSLVALFLAAAAVLLTRVAALYRSVPLRWIWAMSSAASIVVHEAEHLRARDAILVFAGLLTVIAMPWNPGIWWSWRGPLVLIDGVPRPDLPPRRRFTERVSVETTTAPTFAIHYRGATKWDTSAARLYPSGDSIDAMQEIAAPASEAHFGPRARYGATLLYTKRYFANGGKMIAPGEGNVSVRAMPRTATRSDMIAASMKSMYRGIQLDEDQQRRATTIISEYMDQQTAVTNAHAPVLIAWPRRVAITAERNAKGRALLTNDADKATYDATVAEHAMRTLTLEQIAPSLVTEVIQPIELEPARQTRALAIVKTSVNEEMSHYIQNPADSTGRERIVAARIAALRALLTSAERESADAHAERFRRLRARPQQ